MIGYLDTFSYFFSEAPLGVTLSISEHVTERIKNLFTTEEIFIEDTWKSNEACRGWYSSIHNDT